MKAPSAHRPDSASGAPSPQPLIHCARAGMSSARGPQSASGSGRQSLSNNVRMVMESPLSRNRSISAESARSGHEPWHSRWRCKSVPSLPGHSGQT
eukprot:6704616-Pyramimonas_sp.AAC.1